MSTELSSLVDRLDDLEAKISILEPGPEKMGFWMEQVHAYAERFIASLRKGKGYRQGKDDFSDWIDFEQASDLGTLLDQIGRHIDSPGINPASGGHLGYIPGGGIYPSALGDYLAAVSNRYAGIYFANPGAVELENALIRWMGGLFGYPEGALGNLSSGGSLANLIAITAAREKYDVDKTEKYTIYLSAQAHHSNEKAIRIAGLKKCPLRLIPLNEKFQIDPPSFEKLVAADKSLGLTPFLLICSAGTTDTGAVDPLDPLAGICEREGIWMHVDAAYGGFFILVDKLKSLFRGIERADSIVVDPHKGLFLPYGSGAVLVRDGARLRQAFGYNANYMQDAEENPSQVSPAVLSPELTKHFRGLRMWLPLKLFGLDPFRKALEEKYLLCQYFYGKIKEFGFEVGPQPELSVAIYRYIPEKGDPNRFNQALIREIHRDGRIFISSTMIEEKFWLRVAILCFRTHRYHLDLLLNMLSGARDRLLKEGY